MKLIFCSECSDIVSLNSAEVRTCRCGKHSGKYLYDELTAVITKGALVLGIDNTTFFTAVERTIKYKDKKLDPRIDFYFCGWIPTKPGEVIFVDTKDDVEVFKVEDQPDPHGDIKRINDYRLVNYPEMGGISNVNKA